MKITGEYFGQKFTGTVETKLPNWENGSFAKSHGVHLHVLLDTPINHHGLRESLFLHGWQNGKQFCWGSASVTN